MNTLFSTDFHPEQKHENYGLMKSNLGVTIDLNLAERLLPTSFNRK